MSRERILDPQAVEAAEYARKNDRVAVAAEFAAIALGYTSTPINPEELEAITRDPEQRAVLACLARIHVDATKTLANRSLTPTEAATQLEETGRTVSTIYRNHDYARSLLGVTVDHRGREHNFLAEMVRDRAKALSSAAILYSNSEAESMILSAEMLLERAYEGMTFEHPTKGLIGIEIELSRAARGAAVSEQKLLENLYHLVETDSGKNPHRIATVASWLIVWGEKLNLIETARLAGQVFASAIEQHPEWGNMPENERQRLRKTAIRKLVFRALAPITVAQSRRIKIKKSLG